MREKREGVLLCCFFSLFEFKEKTAKTQPYAPGGTPLMKGVEGCSLEILKVNP